MMNQQCLDAHALGLHKILNLLFHFTAKESLSDAQVESMLESNDTHIFAKDVCIIIICLTISNFFFLPHKR